MEKTKTSGLFTNLMALRKTVEKLKEINAQEIEEKEEGVTLYKTLDNIISEKHKKVIK